MRNDNKLKIQDIKIIYLKAMKKSDFHLYRE